MSKDQKSGCGSAVQFEDVSRQTDSRPCWGSPPTKQVGTQRLVGGPQYSLNTSPVGRLRPPGGKPGARERVQDDKLPSNHHQTTFNLPSKNLQTTFTLPSNIL